MTDTPHRTVKAPDGWYCACGKKLTEPLQDDHGALGAFLIHLEDVHGVSYRGAAEGTTTDGDPNG